MDRLPLFFRGLSSAFEWGWACNCLILAKAGRGLPREHESVDHVEGGFRVLPLESVGSLAQGVGHDCLAANGVQLARTGAVSLVEIYRACM